MPKASGGDRKSEHFKSSNSESFEPTKTAAIETAGFTKSQAQRYETIAKHPEEAKKEEAADNQRPPWNTIILLSESHNESDPLLSAAKHGVIILLQ